jgi:hypothetical protein
MAASSRRASISAIGERTEFMPHRNSTDRGIVVRVLLQAGRHQNNAMEAASAAPM